MSSKTERTNISIAPRIREMADALMAARAFSDFSGFVAQLIREEWERRNGPMLLPPAASAPSGTIAAPKEVAAAIAHEAVDQVEAQAGRKKPRPTRGSR